MDIKIQCDYLLSHRKDYERKEHCYYEGSKFYFSHYCVRIDYEDYYRCMHNCDLWEDIRKTNKYFVLKVSGRKITRLFRLLKWDYTVTEWIDK